MRRAFSLLLLVLIGCVVLFFATRKTQPPEPTQQAHLSGSADIGEPSLVEIPALTAETIVDSNPSKHYSVTVHYPRLTLIKNAELAVDANTVIRSFVDDQIEHFVKDVEENANPNLPVDLASDLTVNYHPLLISPLIISLRFDSSEYIAGAAHPNTQTRILNYNLPLHLLLSTGDLFASSSVALPFLSETTRTRLHEDVTPETEEIFQTQTIPGTAPTYENFQEVGITSEGLLVIFNPYQVAPYARGTVEIRLGNDELRSSSTNQTLLAPQISQAIRSATENFREATTE